MEDAALSLSGGIYDIYHTELVLKLTNNTAITDNTTIRFHQNLKRLYGSNITNMVPTIDQLYYILRFAIKSRNIIGVFSMNVSHLY